MSFIIPFFCHCVISKQPKEIYPIKQPKNHNAWYNGRMKTMKKVLIVLEMNDSSGRQQLSGILRFIGMSQPWNIRLVQCAKEHTFELLKPFDINSFDGLLTDVNAGNSDKSLQSILLTSDIPAVFMDSEPSGAIFHGTNPRAYIRVDNRGIGTCAANHLVSLGKFSSFAFLPQKMNPHWSVARGKAFQSQLKRSGHSCHFFTVTDADETKYNAALADWLMSLPKPSALFCAYDTCAVTAARICSECRIAIPEQMSILGVDDDELICNLVSPALSSIRPDFENEGFLAAKMLDMLMNRKSAKRSKVMASKIGGITERGSTRPLSPSGFLVHRAIDFIDKNIRNGISVPDVVAHLGVSTSLLSLRFRQIQGESILQTIRNRRMREVKKLLSSTSYPITRIISMCGFKSENSPKNLFRKMFGMTMSEYRRQNRCTEPHPSISLG